EWLTLISSVIFAVQMLVLDRLGRRMNPSHFTAGFFAVSGAGGLAAAALLAASGAGLAVWVGWTASILGNARVLRRTVWLARLPVLLAFRGMHPYQPRVSASRAALIYLLEPVFTAVFSVWWGFDDVTPALVQGGALILLGNLLVEAPRWLYGRA